MGLKNFVNRGVENQFFEKRLSSQGHFLDAFAGGLGDPSAYYKAFDTQGP